jgi:hypothetical protein
MKHRPRQVRTDGDPTVVIKVVSNSIKAGLGLKPEAVAMAQHSSKI